MDGKGDVEHCVVGLEEDTFWQIVSLIYVLEIITLAMKNELSLRYC
jgi:hypothetical protein